MKKRILTMALAIVLLFALIPAGTEAATTAPAKVTAAMRRAVTENGRVIVVDNSAGKVYLFKDGKLKKVSGAQSEIISTLRSTTTY